MSFVLDSCYQINICIHKYIYINICSTCIMLLIHIFRFHSLKFYNCLVCSSILWWFERKYPQRNVRPNRRKYVTVAVGFQVSISVMVSSFPTAPKWKCSQFHVCLYVAVLHAMVILDFTRWNYKQAPSIKCFHL